MLFVIVDHISLCAGWNGFSGHSFEDPCLRLTATSKWQ